MTETNPWDLVPDGIIDKHEWLRNATDEELEEADSIIRGDRDEEDT